MSEHVASCRPWQMPVRFSRLKLMGKSAKIYRASFDRPQPDSAGMRAGRLIHAVALGGNVAVFCGKRNTNAFREFEIEHQGSEIALESEYEEAIEVKAALDAHPEARRLLTGHREYEIAWTDDGRACGARLDVLGEEPNGAGFVSDLKTTACAEPEWFMRNAERMAYHAQLAWYRRGASIALKRPVQNAYIVAIEPRYPYEIVTFPLSLATLDYGERQWRKWWEHLMVCEQSNIWPGYSEAPREWNVTGNSEIDFDE